MQNLVECEAGSPLQIEPSWLGPYSDLPFLQQVGLLASTGDPYWERAALEGKSVRIYSLAQAAKTDSDINNLDIASDPRPRHCYWNAIAYLFNNWERGIRYVEGLVYDKSTRTINSHAWIQIGDRHYDPTYEHCFPPEMRQPGWRNRYSYLSLCSLGIEDFERLYGEEILYNSSLLIPPAIARVWSIELKDERDRLYQDATCFQIAMGIHQQLGMAPQ